MGEMKQIIVIRNDLNMRKGKMVAQGAHASLGAILKHQDDPRVIDWLANSFTKVCVRVDSLDELLDLHFQAVNAGLLSSLIKDNGRTEFNGVPTYTALGVGPDTPEKLDPITGHLKLL